jgi:hypothetical protein
VFLRRSDGLVVQLESFLLFWFKGFEGVFRDIGETADADEIRAEIIARSKAYWAEQGLDPDAPDPEESIHELTETLGTSTVNKLVDAGLLGDEYRTREPGA